MFDWLGDAFGNAGDALTTAGTSGFDWGSVFGAGGDAGGLFGDIGSILGGAGNTGGLDLSSLFPDQNVVDPLTVTALPRTPGFTLNLSDLANIVGNVPGLVTPDSIGPVDPATFPETRGTHDPPAGPSGGSGGSNPVPGIVRSVVGAATHGGGSGGGGGILNLLANPAILGLLPSIYQAIQSGNTTDLGPDAAALRSIASGNQTQVEPLRQEAASEKMGLLPGPAMQALGLGTREQEAALRTSYSRLNMSGSTAEASDIADLHAKQEAQRFQIGLDMANQGLQQVSNLTGQNVSIYSGLLSEQIAQDNAYRDAMAKLAGAIGQAFGTATNGLPSGQTGTPIAPGNLPGQPGVTPLTPISPVGTDITPASVTTNVPDLVTPASLPDLSTLTPPGNFDTPPSIAGLNQIDPNQYPDWLNQIDPSAFGNA